MTQLPRLKIKLDPVIEGNYITCHPTTGWSRYKEWPADRWEVLIEKIQANSKVPVRFIQIGIPTDYKLVGCDHSFMDSTLLKSMALIANAQFHMGGDSFSNHVTHLAGTKALILWGSTQESASGYPENINISMGLPCQPCFKEREGISAMTQGPCENLIDGVHACMAEITVDFVYSILQNQLG
jgi:ADP-heptose:LPS heptosyltransferase